MPADFEREAKRYREMAAAEPVPALADQLLGYAKQYEAWAAIIADEVLRQPKKADQERA